MQPSPQAPETRNLIVAFGLSLAILFGYQYFYAGPQEARMKAAAEAQQKLHPETVQAGTNPVTGAPASTPALGRDQALALATRIPVATPTLSGTISTVGARLDDLSLTQYPAVMGSNAPAHLLNPHGTLDSFYGFFGFLIQNNTAPMPGPDTVWTAPANARLTPTTPLVLTWDNGAGLSFERTIGVDENYLFTITDKVTNKGAATVNIQPYGTLRRAQGITGPRSSTVHEGAVAMFNHALMKVDYRKLDKGEHELETSTGGWLGITDKYFMAALVPAQAGPFEATIRTNPSAGGHGYETAFVAAPMAVAGGQSAQVVQHFYAGAKSRPVLEAYSKNLNVPRMEDAIDWGKLRFLTHPLHKLLIIFNGWTGNIGLSILLLTVVIKVVTFPLVYTSYKSFAKLRELGPKMKEVQAKYAADPQRQQQEVMKLYKEEKVNPVAGCVPMLLQMPIFFALFKVLSISIELRHAPFYGWIHDLSAKDPTTLFNIFGLLPFDPTSWPVIGSMLGLGAWPILYGLSFALLQKMQPTATDPVQARVFALMPIMFVIMFAGFPSALVIYYTWSNILTIIQQYFIARQMGTHNPIDEFFAKRSGKAIVEAK